MMRTTGGDSSRKAKLTREPAATGAASTMAPATARASGERGWYVKVQGNNCELVESSERPSVQHEKGEPLITVTGPFSSRATAEQVYARTNNKMHGRGSRRSKEG